MNIEAFKMQNGYETEGFWLPRVTTITSIISKPAFFRYYAQHSNFMSAQNALNHSASWGTAVHKAVEMLLKNKKHRPDEKILDSVGAFRDWQGQNKVKILDPENDVERTIFDLDNFYAGTLDILAEINGVFGILDIKTGSGIWDEYGLQLAAYMNAYNKNAPAKRRAKTRWILRLDQFEKCTICGAKKRIKSGKPKITGGKRGCLHQFSQTKGAFQFKELDGFKEDLQGFLSAKKLWEWSNRNILKEIKNYPENKKTKALF